MNKLEKLRKQAIILCENRGHKMGRFDRTYRYWWAAECRVCGRGVTVRDEPHPDCIAISGISQERNGLNNGAVTAYCGRIK